MAIVLVQVVMSEWEQACCGEPFAVGDEVTWQLLAADPALIPDGEMPRFLEEHHGQTPDDVPHLAVTGHVVAIEAVRYPRVAVVGEARSFTLDEARPERSEVNAVAASGGDADEYWIELDAVDPSALPTYMASAQLAERERADAESAGRMRARQADRVGQLLERLAEDAVARFSRVATITREPARPAVTIEPHTPGATTILWSRSTQEDDRLSAHVGEGHWWDVPATEAGVELVQGLLDAAAAGRVREDVIALDGLNRQLNTVAWDENGREWTSSTTVEPLVLSEGSFAVAGDGWERAQRGPRQYAPWT